MDSITLDSDGGLDSGDRDGDDDRHRHRHRKKPQVYKIVLAQLAVLLPLCLVLSGRNITATYSAALGAVVCVVANAYFTSYAFRYRFTGADAAHRIVRAFYWGETGKYLLTVVGFSLIFLLVDPLHVPALFFAYGLMLVVQLYISAHIVSLPKR